MAIVPGIQIGKILDLKTVITHGGNIIQNASLGGDSIVTDGLILWLDATQLSSYPGTGATWLDLTSYGNDATYMPYKPTDIPVFHPEIDGGSIEFSGMFEWWSFLKSYPPSGNPLDFTTEDFTLLAFVRIPSPQLGTGSAILWKGSDFTTPSSGYMLAGFDVTPTPISSFANGGTLIEKDFGLPVEIENKPIMLGLTKLNNDMATIVNGVMEVFSNIVPGGFDLKTTGIPLRLGRGSVKFDSNHNFFKGLISSIMIYKRSLTQSEIMQNYLVQSQKFTQ